MSRSGKFNRHADLVDRMAKVVGVDLDEAVQRGELASEDVRTGVYKCIGCSETEACEHWIEGQGKGADVAPGYCRNAELFKGLKK